MELLDTADLDAELAQKLAFSLPSSPAFSASPLRRTLSPTKQFQLAPAGSGGTPPRTPLLRMQAAAAAARTTASRACAAGSRSSSSWRRAGSCRRRLST